MKVIVIGGVAAGTKTAAKLKRENRNAEVIIYTKSQDISYAGCGLPYYVGGDIESREELIVNTPQKYQGLTGVQVVTGTEAVSVNTDEKTVVMRKVADQSEESRSRTICSKCRRNRFSRRIQNENTRRCDSDKSLCRSKQL